LRAKRPRRGGTGEREEQLEGVLHDSKKREKNEPASVSTHEGGHS